MFECNEQNRIRFCRVLFANAHKHAYHHARTHTHTHIRTPVGECSKSHLYVRTHILALNPLHSLTNTHTHTHTHTPTPTRTGQEYYRGPVPLVTHLHGAHTEQFNDGFPNAWYLPNGMVTCPYVYACARVCVLCVCVRSRE